MIDDDPGFSRTHLHAIPFAPLAPPALRVALGTRRVAEVPDAHAKVLDQHIVGPDVQLAALQRDARRGAV